MKFFPTSSLLCSLLLLASSATDAQELKTAVASNTEMVVSAHFLATAAGQEMLTAGGTAADAMVAVQTVLGLVEPQSSGIAGGAFAVYYDAAEDKITTYDAREKAPALATEARFVDPVLNTSLDFFDAWQSGLSVGVAGVPRLMEMIHSKYGTLEWATLFEPAKKIATEGFNVSHRMEDNANELLIENANCTARQAGWYILDKSGVCRHDGLVCNDGG
jgi:gamma-glutamyltranspeptidase / glutathione hydrolase